MTRLQVTMMMLLLVCGGVAVVNSSENPPTTPKSSKEVEQNPLKSPETGATPGNSLNDQCKQICDNIIENALKNSKITNDGTAECKHAICMDECLQRVGGIAAKLEASSSDDEHQEGGDLESAPSCKLSLTTKLMIGTWVAAHLACGAMEVAYRQQHGTSESMVKDFTFGMFSGELVCMMMAGILH